MFRYFLYKIKKEIKPRKALLFFNTSFSSYKKRIYVLTKSGVKHGEGTSITQPFYFEFGKIELHENILINSGCTFLDNEKITIMRNSMIGPNVILSTVSHYVDPKSRHAGNITAPINIGYNVWIGAGCVICPGVSIGDNCVIAANSVVTEDVPDNSFYAGSPATLRKKLDD